MYIAISYIISNNTDKVEYNYEIFLHNFIFRLCERQLQAVTNQAPCLANSYQSHLKITLREMVYWSIFLL